jgi:hypothetical protein
LRTTLFPSCYVAANVRQSGAAQQVCAAQQTVLEHTAQDRRGSAFCDIHKNLWITMWIVDELRRFAQSGDAQRRSRSKNEQRFAVEN